MKFAVLMFIGAVSAQCYTPPPPPCAAPIAAAYSSYSSGGAASADSCLKGVSTYLAPGQAGTLRARSAGSATEVGAQVVAVPDKIKVTDQAKVTESCSKSQFTDTNSKKSKSIFEVSGGFTFTQSEKSSLKGSKSKGLTGETQGQALQREQVESNLCAQACVPCTDLPAPAPLC